MEIPTDLLSARPRTRRRHRLLPSPSTAGPLRQALSRSAPEALEPARGPAGRRGAARAAESRGAERPLIWAGGGALQSGAGPAVAALAEKLAAPVITTYSARGLLPPGHPCLVDAPPHVPSVGAVWDEADVVLAIGSDFDGMMTLGWKLPQPPTLIAINVDLADAAKNYPARRHDRGGRRAGVRRSLDASRAAGPGGARQRRPRCAPRCATEIGDTDPEAPAFLTGSNACCRRTRRWSATCAFPATGSAAS